MFVLCLIANPDEPELTPEIVNAVHHQVGGTINWLAQSVACEIISPVSENALQVAKELTKGLPLDCVLVPRKFRRKKLLIADMDSTMIEQECIDELANILDKKPEVAEITRKAMQGEIDFHQSLSLRIKLLQGLDKKTMETLRREQITLAPGGRVLVQTMKQYGAFSALVTGGFTLFANYFGQRIGFDETIANVFEFDSDDKLTGTLASPVIDSEAKAYHLRRLTSELKIAQQESIAVGDGANDLEMLKAAGMGVALHAKPVVAAAAPISLNHADLTALLYLQGYSEEEFVR